MRRTRFALRFALRRAHLVRLAKISNFEGSVCNFDHSNVTVTFDHSLEWSKSKPQAIVSQHDHNPRPKCSDWEGGH